MNRYEYDIKRLQLTDIDQIMKVEQSAWDTEWQATREKITSRIKIFNEGCIGIFTKSGELAGYSTSMIKQTKLEDLDKGHSWDEITDNGYITNHNNEGNCLYVLSVSVSSSFQNMGFGKKLVEAQKNILKAKRLDFVYLGARIPQFRKYIENKFHEFNMEQIHSEAKLYAHLKREDGMYEDPEIRFYGTYCGFNVVDIVENFGPDYPSMNFGVIMLWKD
jgi:ribosomal protein S18 acetylase RimI-like enzyme